MTLVACHTDHTTSPTLSSEPYSYGLAGLVSTAGPRWVQTCVPSPPASSPTLQLPWVALPGCSSITDSTRSGLLLVSALEPSQDWSQSLLLPVLCQLGLRSSSASSEQSPAISLQSSSITCELMTRSISSPSTRSAVSSVTC